MVMPGKYGTKASASPGGEHATKAVLRGAYRRMPEAVYVRPSKTESMPVPACATHWKTEKVLHDDYRVSYASSRPTLQREPPLAGPKPIRRDYVCPIAYGTGGDTIQVLSLSSSLLLSPPLSLSLLLSLLLSVALN